MASSDAVWTDCNSESGDVSDRIIALAARAAQKLEGYCMDDLNTVAENDDEIAEVVNDSRFLRAFDSMIFQCKTCGYWMRQRENATPDAAEWECQECFAEGS